MVFYHSLTVLPCRVLPFLFLRLRRRLLFRCRRHRRFEPARAGLSLLYLGLDSNNTFNVFFTITTFLVFVVSFLCLLFRLFGLFFNMFWPISAAFVFVLCTFLLYSAFLDSELLRALGGRVAERLRVSTDKCSDAN